MLEMDLYSPIELFPGESDDDYYRITMAAFEESPPPDDCSQPIPAGFDEMPPGPFLAAILSSIDVSRLKGRDVVVVLRAQHRQVAHHQAGEYEATGEVAFRVDADTTARSQAPNEFAIEEVGSALTLTRRKADHELSIALDLRRRLPSVHSALKSGDIDARKASLLAPRPVTWMLVRPPM